MSASESTHNPFRPPAPGVLPAAGDFASPQIAGDRIRAQWTLVEDIRRDESGIYLFIGPAQALILPRRIFPNDADFSRAFVQIEEFHRAGKSAGAIV